MTIQQRSVEFLWYNLIAPIYEAIVNLCKKKEIVSEEDFLPACISGDFEKIQKINTENIDLNQGLDCAVQAGHLAIAEYLIKKGATNLDENLKFACINNKFAMAEMLVQKGARVIVGLRVAKSINIIKMLHRYEQNAEMIN